MGRDGLAFGEPTLGKSRVEQSCSNESADRGHLRDARIRILPPVLPRTSLLCSSPNGDGPLEDRRVQSTYNPPRVWYHLVALGAT